MFTQQFTVLDLFAGCGGMSWGLHSSGFKVLAGVDNWKQALETFTYNHHEAQALCADLETENPKIILERLALETNQVDVIIGGPPCQGFSKNVPASYRFLEDPRNQLFRRYLDYVELLRPKVVVMENVAEIYNAYNGTIRQDITTRLEQLGYNVVVKVLFAPDYGVPQRRRRCFFFASRTQQSPVFPSPSFAPQETPTLLGAMKQYRSAWMAMSDLPVLHNGDSCEPFIHEIEPTNEYQELMRTNATVVYDHITRPLNTQQLARFLSIRPGQGLKDLPDELRPKSGYSGAYGRLDFDMIAPTGRVPKELP